MISVVLAQGIVEADPDLQAPNSFGDLNIIFENVIGAAIPLAGIVLFILLIVGGFQFITSGGDPGRAEQAKKTLTYAIGGIVVVALAFLILQVIELFTGVTVTEFDITG